MARRSLRLTILVLAAIAVTTGTISALFGTDVIAGGDATSKSVESELRFYAVWYLGAGVFLASLAPRIEQRGAALRGVCLVLFLGGIGRVLAIAGSGWPHPLYVGLMALELLLPPVLVLWQARVARASHGAEA